MRYLYIVVVVMFMSGGIAFAADADQKSGPGASQDGGAAVRSQEKEIVVDSNERRSDDKEFGVGNQREMPNGETYDQNTGLPNVVESDREGEIR